MPCQSSSAQLSSALKARFFLSAGYESIGPWHTLRDRAFGGGLAEASPHTTLTRKEPHETQRSPSALHIVMVCLILALQPISSISSSGLEHDRYPSEMDQDLRIKLYYACQVATNILGSQLLSGHEQSGCALFGCERWIVIALMSTAGARFICSGILWCRGELLLEPRYITSEIILRRARSLTGANIHKPIAKEMHCDGLSSSFAQKINVPAHHIFVACLISKVST